MGVLNVTPDSFSDGGMYLDPEKAVERALEMARQGASIIDVGAESTRPGSAGVGPSEQIRRVAGVIESIVSRVTVPVSIDTRNCRVARAALDAGAAMINDVTALKSDRMCRLAAERQVPVVLMHMRGDPATMQKNCRYGDVTAEVVRFLVGRALRAQRFGIRRDLIFIDPGIGFGKTAGHNVELLRNIDRFTAAGYRVLVGTSRKSFLGHLTGRRIPSERLFGTAATIALCAAAGVSVVRVHDVAEMAEVAKVACAIHPRAGR
jgi:dihydropteroate synthase